MKESASESASARQTAFGRMLGDRCWMLDERKIRELAILCLLSPITHHPSPITLQCRRKIYKKEAGKIPASLQVQPKPWFLLNLVSYLLPVRAVMNVRFRSPLDSSATTGLVET